jgi:Ca-activated chloride channel family protein
MTESGAFEAEYILADDASGAVNFNTEEYDRLIENGFCTVASSPVSTFSADVDTASYCNVRRLIEDGCRLEDIPAGAARTEEMLNYFTYDYDSPEEGKPFSLTASISTCPWNEDSQLLVCGITTKDYDYEDIGGCNYVFLVDTSGSMGDYNKLELVKESLFGLLEQLSDKDRISIVTYAGSFDVLARGVYGDDRDQLKRIIGSLGANGSTNGSAGIIEAYRLAEEYFIENGVNRIIMCSDGDLNVGITSESDLYDLVSEKRESGVYLSVLGFGTGNYSDSRMETLADNGNGNYYYIDCIEEAEKVLCDELVSTLVTVAEDVKFQIEFNPNYVQEYRQIGYENRQLKTEDFENDMVDAGEVGSGCCLTVVYEIIPAVSSAAAGDTELKYQTSALTEAADSDEWMTVSVRYKDPGEDESKLLEYTIGSGDITDRPSSDWRFAAAVCQFAMLLHDSDYKGSTTIGSVLELVQSLDLGNDPYKAEFAALVEALA